MIIVPLLQQRQVPIYNCKIDPKGPIAIPVNVDFTTNTHYDLDGSQIEHLGFIDFLQTIYVDTTGAASAVTITVQGSSQTIVAPKNTQGYYPILSPNPWKLSFDSAANSSVQIILFNNPISPGVWPVV